MDEQVAVISFCWIFSYTMLAILVAVMAIAPVNFIVILRTSVVHPHLKFVLLVQSGFAGVGAVIHIVNLILNFREGDCLWQGAPLWLNSFLTFDVQFFALIGHVLLVERVLATAWANHYEHWRSRWFSGGWFIMLTVLSLGQAIGYYITNHAQEVSGRGNQSVQECLAGMIIINIVTVVNFVEIIAITKLRIYNASKYAQRVFYSHKKRTLSERYQLSENVRTIHRLGPIFFAHFAEMFALVILINIIYFNAVDALLMKFLIVVYMFLHSITLLVIVVAVIFFHPALKAHALCVRLYISRTLCCSGNRVGTEVTSDSHHRSTTAKLQTLMSTEAEAHFRAIEQCWAEHDQNR